MKAESKLLHPKTSKVSPVDTKASPCQEADAALRAGTIDAKVGFKLGRDLKKIHDFPRARRIFALARKSNSADTELATKLRQQHALSTSKDPDLRASERHDWALAILVPDEPLGSSEDPETLGIAGGIYKRRWEFGGNHADLERSYASYTRGFEVAQASDYGGRSYCGINAAYVGELLAQARRASLEELGTNGASPAPIEWEQRAEQIRKDLATELEPLVETRKIEGLEANDWWLVATLAEAWIGLGEWEKARGVVELLAGLKGDSKGDSSKSVPRVDPWEFETTVHQLLSIVRLREARERSTGAASACAVAARGALRALWPAAEEAIDSRIAGKFGIALSGGGFRASLFHLGVLARLAELRLLRHVEVISCVSGGSIVGALYYSKLKRLLETKSDEEIADFDYVAIVNELIRVFVAGVQKNIRTSVAGSFWANLRMMFSSSYSRTRRLGELYEEHFYRDALDKAPGEPCPLRELLIRPKGIATAVEFFPKRDNFGRRAKVPILILNATCLNSGHTWQFTAASMGEPPQASPIDANDRLRRVRYDDAALTDKEKDDSHRRDEKKRLRDFGLGEAVAASSCVPGLFEPVVIDGLYPIKSERDAASAPLETEGNGESASNKTERLAESSRSIWKRLLGGPTSLVTPISASIRLVDGGVRDNQGIDSLLVEECKVVLVSDASGQLDGRDCPDRHLFGVLFRSNSITMASVRDAVHAKLEHLESSGVLRHSLFLHLKRDLDGADRAWLDCEEPPDPTKDDGVYREPDDADAKRSELHPPRTAYEVPKAIQSALSDLRTDLDAFSDVEAHALMLSGYRMTRTYECELFGSEDLCAPVRDTAVGPKDGWPFERSATVLLPADKAALVPVLRRLDAGRKSVGKMVALSRRLWCVSLVAGVLALCGLLFFAWNHRDHALLRVDYILGTGLALGTSVVIGRFGARFVFWRDAVQRIAAGLALGTVGAAIAKFWLFAFRGWYLSVGKIQVVEREQRAAREKAQRGNRASNR
jgi:predicted acylesterase/phospholipase RssA